MPKLATPLTDIQVRNAKPKGKAYTIGDGNGMYLEVSPNGAKRWRMSYRQKNGKNNRLTFGGYPLVSLADAREQCIAARKLLKADTDPAADRDKSKRMAADRALNTFEKLAREWHSNKIPTWKESTAKDTLHRL